MDFKVHEAACITRHQHGVQGAFVQRSPFAEAPTLSWKQARANSSMRKDMLPARDSKSSLDNLPGCPLLSLNTIAHRVLTQLKHSLLFAETIKMGYLLVGEHVSLIGPLDSIYKLPIGHKKIFCDVQRLVFEQADGQASEVITLCLRGTHFMKDLNVR